MFFSIAAMDDLAFVSKCQKLRPCDGAGKSSETEQCKNICHYKLVGRKPKSAASPSLEAKAENSEQ